MDMEMKSTKGTLFNIMKAVGHRPSANTKLNGEKPAAVGQDEDADSALLLSAVLQALVRALREETAKLEKRKITHTCR